MAAMTDSAIVEELVTLTMEERVGLDRADEWVTIGVPLPKGKVSSIDQLAVLRDGKPVAAEILPVNRWWKDDSLRWVHIIFPTDCRARGKTSVSLALTQCRVADCEEEKRIGNAILPKPVIKVTEEDDRFLLDTGVLKFQVRKHGFNVIDTAEIANKAIISTHGRGLGIQVDSQKYLASLDTNVQVELEELGPLHAVLHTTGSFKDKSGNRKFDFDCRIYAYANSANVKIVVTLINRQGKTPDFIPLSGLFLEFPTAVENGKCRFGAEDGSIKEGSLIEHERRYTSRIRSITTKSPASSSAGTSSGITDAGTWLA